MFSLLLAVVFVLALYFWYRRPVSEEHACIEQQSPKKKPRTSRRSRQSKKHGADTTPPLPLSVQPVDVFLVLDVEATCQQGTDLNYPNEIIEFPICLLRWKDRSVDDRASKLEIAAEFRSFVKPSWRPLLSQFCSDLTGITQDQVDGAPLFPEVLSLCRQFLVENGLIDPKTGQRLVRYCWCSDGPFDIRDFVVKQCFISKISMPDWLRGDILDARMTVSNWLDYRSRVISHRTYKGIRRSFNIPAQLKALGLPEFEGRQHSGIDDCRNISRIMIELARREITLVPNTSIHLEKKWHWMGQQGQILEWNE